MYKRKNENRRLAMEEGAGFHARKMFDLFFNECDILWLRPSVGGGHNLQTGHNLFYRRKSQKDDGEDRFRKNVA